MGNYLCDQIIQISEYRMTLYDYLRNRMQAIAPNLTILVGELVGARLISHAGSLMNLAKHPASTVQILGAEKALFKALKTKHDTPKYGLIYHAQLVGQARAKVESRIRQLEGGQVAQISGSAKKSAKFDKYEATGEVLEYKAAADVTSGKRKGSADSDDEEEKPAVKKVKVEEVEVKSEKKKKKKKEKEAAVEANTTLETTADASLLEDGGEKKKKKKKKKEAAE